MELPDDPMAPINADEIPSGSDWGYQLKWDGVRLLSAIEDGRIEIYSRKLLNKNAIFPEVVKVLGSVQHKCLLDGEVVIFDPEKGRPSFQRVLQRERSKKAIRSEQLQPTPICYVLFDLLFLGDKDLRATPYRERHRLLSELFPEKKPQLFVCDLFHDGGALWKWVQEHEWEGIVSKRLTSMYKTGKKHNDWYKKKTTLEFSANIVGLIIRDGHVASMVMADSQRYVGRVSLGLDLDMKSKLLAYGKKHEIATNPFTALPADLKKEQVLWLSRPFECEVTGLEMTEGGLLRHPKIRALHQENFT